MWIEPMQPGTYVGNCAEYCGMQHAHMLLRVIVHPPGDFEKWVAAQREPPVDDPKVQSRPRHFLCYFLYQLSRYRRHKGDGHVWPRPDPSDES